MDATALIGKWKGQLVAACAVDGHNWLFPVSYGVVEVENEQSWRWFLGNLHKSKGDPVRLVIHIDACEDLQKAVETVFPEAEPRECTRHLVANFKKHFKGKVFDANLWPASYTCNEKKYRHHLKTMYDENPTVKP